MPKVQYLGPYDRREINAADLGREVPEAAEGETPEPEMLVWEREGESVELSDEEWAQLRGQGGGSTWALEAEPDAIDESSSKPESASSDSGSGEEAGKTA